MSDIDDRVFAAVAWKCLRCDEEVHPSRMEEHQARHTHYDLYLEHNGGHA